MTEREEAIATAEAILDQPSRDPDDTESLLARQLLRTHEILKPLAYLIGQCGAGPTSPTMAIRRALRNPNCTLPEAERELIRQWLKQQLQNNGHPG